MLHLEKDPTLRTLAEQEALAARGLYTGPLDNWRGPRHEDALRAYQETIRARLAADTTATSSNTNPPPLPPSNTTPPPAPSLPPTTHRDVSPAGIQLIKHFEGLYLRAYQDSVGIWTVGWGHTGLRHNDGTVRPGRVITAAEAETLLRLDLDFFEGDVQRLITVPLSHHEFAALVSFHFNTGGLADSTLRRKLNAGDRPAAADQFLRWDKAGGRTLPGLTRRRKSERNLFLGKENFIEA